MDFVIGEKINPPVVNQLVQQLNAVALSGTLYVGYPLISPGQETKPIDAMLTCREFGVVVFDLHNYANSPIEIESIRERQDDFYAETHKRLFNHKPLRANRALAIGVNVVTLVPSLPPSLVEDGEVLVATPSTLIDLLHARCQGVTEDQLKQIDAVFQRVTTLKPQHRRKSVRRPDSRGAIIKQIEAEIANLDKWQKHAAIETAECPQRIRGLAGCGKAVVLALKAAELHARHPDWAIVVTYYTRSLHQQFTALISRFYREFSTDEPDWNTLQVMHAWGSFRDAGVYSSISAACGVEPHTYGSAKAKFGSATAFQGACEELLEASPRGASPPLFDVVLIDEAQDMPRAYF